MARWRCYNCNPNGIPGQGREFANDAPECPSCHAIPPAVIPLVDVHWLAPGGGPIPTATGPRRVACQPQRTNFVRIHVTAQPDAVTCPACLKVGGDEHAKLLAAFREENGP